ARVLYCLGLRAEESSGRAKKPVLSVDDAASSGVREVVTWLPIRHWTEAEVWARIKASGVRYHWAYDKGMKRLSCSF
ncbi:phosphoadenosine phosphosulfate reductase family protein, partial [Streptomyces sp. A73]|nr:phosphoadenosine phosphosulfate reductase family protein [Streptomyces sp. A73]